MKARDIIPGWPLGYSTSRPYRVDPVQRFMWNLRMTKLSLRCCIRLMEEDDANVAYHDWQNRMIERYIKEQCVDVQPIVSLKAPRFI